MSDIPKYIIGILIGILIVGGAVMLFSHPNSDTTNVTDDSSLSNAVQEQVDTISNDVNSTISNVTNTATSNASTNTAPASNGSGALQSSQNGVTGGHVEHNYQEGNSDFYEIQYADGNVRQYDTKTGELIGSTFDEDQEKLAGLYPDVE